MAFEALRVWILVRAIAKSCLVEGGGLACEVLMVLMLVRAIAKSCLGEGVVLAFRLVARVYLSADCMFLCEIARMRETWFSGSLSSASRGDGVEGSAAAERNFGVGVGGILKPWFEEDMIELLSPAK